MRQSLNEIIRAMGGARLSPIVDTEQVMVARRACEFLFNSHRRSLLLRAQDMLAEGTLDLSRVNLEKFGLL